MPLCSCGLAWPAGAQEAYDIAGIALPILAIEDNLQWGGRACLSLGCLRPACKASIFPVYACMAVCAQEAVEAVMGILGMQACEGTEAVPPNARSHTVLLSGVLVGHDQVRVRCRHAADGCAGPDQQTHDVATGERACTLCRLHLLACGARCA